MIFKYKFSWKFYAGIVLVILSFLMGKATVATFLLHRELSWRIGSVIVYILSWPILFVGILWIGIQYGEAVKRYMSYRFYHDSLKEGTKKVVGKTREKTLGLRDKMTVQKNKVKSKKKV